jgi:hypothetical protein
MRPGAKAQIELLSPPIQSFQGLGTPFVAALRLAHRKSSDPRSIRASGGTCVQFCPRLNLFRRLGAKICPCETPFSETNSFTAAFSSTPKPSELKEMGWRHVSSRIHVVSDPRRGIFGRFHPAASCLRWAVRSVRSPD